MTHGLAGLLVADAASEWMTRRGHPPTPSVRRAASVLGIVAAEFPDSDLVYSGPVLDMGTLGYLLHHRGHTHTLVWAVVGALMLWGAACWWVARGRQEGEGVLHTQASGAAAWRRALLVVALVGTLSHILLDWTNSYGVHPFWPFDGRWYYGDAVFIVEPWLWLIAIPALIWHRPSRVGPVVLALGYVLILAAVVLLGQVARDVTVLLLVFAALWPFLMRVVRAPVRIVAGVGTWVIVTVAFFGASARADASVRAAVATTGTGAPQVLDVALTPAPGDWGCWSAVVMTRSRTEYRVTSAFVAPFPTVRPLALCHERYRVGRVGSDVLAGLAGADAARFGATATVGWRSSWGVPLASVATLVRDHCEADAAWYFMRAPVWQRVGDARWLLSDARFGVGGGGFSEVVLPATGACSLPHPWIPAWVPPRADLFE